MDLVNAVGAVLRALLGIAAASFAALATDQVRASVPAVASWLARSAAARLPVELREENQEEWLSVLANTRGPLSKLVTAVGFFFAARAIAADYQNEHVSNSHLQSNQLSPLEQQVADAISEILGHLPPERALLTVRAFQLALARTNEGELSEAEFLRAVIAARAEIESADADKQ
jgi:hypothetical protein